MSASKIILPILILCLLFMLAKTIASAQVESVDLIVSIVPGASNPSTPTPYYPSPIDLHLKPSGVIVMWTNNDNVVHTVASSTNSFNSPVLAPTQSFTWTFFNGGYYSYYCELHPFMNGVITIS